MQSMTITEALAEIKTIAKRLQTKRQFVGQYLARQQGLRDPLENEGGSVEAIRAGRQAIDHLETRIIRIRKAIASANASLQLTIGGCERTISEWLVWRREISNAQLEFLRQMQNQISGARDKCAKQGFKIVSNEGQATEGTDLIININEMELAKEIEQVELILGVLDGKLSLANATTMVEIAD